MPDTKQFLCNCSL